MSHPGNEALSLLPIGGLGEIGMNMMMIRCGRRALVVECGVMFAGPQLPGIDLIVPDFDPVLDPAVEPAAVLLTHGHEDHIGAVPYLLRQRNIPVFGSPFTAALVEAKLKEHGLSASSDLRRVKEGDRVHLPPFEVEFIRISHSIPDALALAIRTPQGMVVHTGDFKIDPEPADGRTTDLKRLEALGREGVLLLLSDSTNVESAGPSLSETSVRAELDSIISGASGRVFIVTFASHIPRVRQVLEIAKERGKRVCLAGRSMEQNVSVARAIGNLSVPDRLFVDASEVGDKQRNDVVVLCTGTQGEPRSALTRMALDEYGNLRIIPGDTVVYSSRFIPGNEKAIYSTINHLYRRGAEVITPIDRHVHVSGHGRRGDLEAVLRAVRPRFFIPVHGEYRHLVKHVKLAVETGIPLRHTLLLENGESAQVTSTTIRRLPAIPLSPSVVDGREMEDIASEALRERRKLALTGTVVAVVVLDKRTGDIEAGPELFARGLIAEESLDSLLDDASEQVRRALHRIKGQARADQAVAEEEVRLAVVRFFRSRIEKKPVVIPIVLTV